jgi:hypothetical protein
MNDQAIKVNPSKQVIFTLITHCREEILSDKMINVIRSFSNWEMSQGHSALENENDGGGESIT